jgi:phospholipid/cholesterol/gamma-HCH transport system substrate-binding protein
LSKRGVSPARVLVAIAFALSCFGLALFLWVSFGGPVPLAPKSYEFTVPFDEATQLAQQSDVRISGVSVGKVSDIKLADDGLADATISIDAQYAPVPANTRAILRQKTLLGETYVELTPGNGAGPMLPEGATLPKAQVANSVQLDEIFRTFNAKTRANFQVWMQQQALAFKGRGADFSAAIGELPPFLETTNRLLRVLDTQRLAVKQLVRNGGEVFRALSERRGELSSLIRNSDRVFSTTAQRNQDLASTFRILPTFLDESKATLNRLETFATDADPLVKQLEPAAKQLTPTLNATRKLAPGLEHLFAGLLHAIPAAKTGFPALRGLITNDLTPLISRYDSFGQQLDSLLVVLRNYKREITAFFGNSAGALEGIQRGPEDNFAATHYIRTEAIFGPEFLAAFPHRLKVGRSNPYTAPGGYNALANLGFLKGFETSQCSNGIKAKLDPNSPSDPNFQHYAGGTMAGAQDLFNRVKEFVYDNHLNSNKLPTPKCQRQAPQRSIGINKEKTLYQHVRREP